MQNIGNKVTILAEARHAQHIIGSMNRSQRQMLTVPKGEDHRTTALGVQVGGTIMEIDTPSEP